MVDTSAFLNENVELIFTMEQDSEPRRVEFHRTSTRGEREVVRQWNVREVPANSGTVTFKVQVSNLGNDPRFTEYQNPPNNTREAKVRVRIGPESNTTLYVKPRVAKLELSPGSPKGTELIFEVDFARYKSRRTEVIFYYAQPPVASPDLGDVERKLVEIGRVSTNDGYVLWTKQIRDTALNRGQVRFYARVGNPEQGSEIAFPGSEPNPTRAMGFRVDVE